MNYQMLDLSHPIHDGMVTYPGLPAPRISAYLSRAASSRHYGDDTQFDIGRIDMVANTGTYIDAPYHRFAGQADIAQLPLERLANLPGICIDAGDRRRIGIEAIEDKDTAGRAVLFCTGWSRHFGTDKYGAGHPFVTSNAAKKLAERGALLVGIDSLNIDDTEDGLRPAHTSLLAAGIPIVEHLRGLEALVGETFRMFAVPAPVTGIGSFPVRAFAIVEESA